MSLVDLETGEFVCSYSENRKTVFDADTGEFISFLDLGDRDEGLSLPYYSFAWLEVIAREMLNQLRLKFWLKDGNDKRYFRKMSFEVFRSKDYYYRWLFNTAFYSIEELAQSSGSNYNRWARKKLLRDTQTNRVVRHVWRSYPQLRRYIEDRELLSN